MNRREMLQGTGAAALTLGISSFPLSWANARASTAKKRVYCFTRSEGFQHECVTRHNGQLSVAERILTDLGKRHGFEVTCSKNGRDFDHPEIESYDAFFFETQGNLTSKGHFGDPPLSEQGKERFLNLIANGKGFIGAHCASDTCHSPGNANENQPPDRQDPYIRMLGGEFVRHDSQQFGWMMVADGNFPGLQGIDDFVLFEEWYALKNFNAQMHVILVQGTKGMNANSNRRNVFKTSGMYGTDYQRPPYPATWAHLHQKGRVFYTSMGHRRKVWQNPIFHQVLLGGLAWALGNVEADISPNLSKAAPEAGVLPNYR